jgi:glucose-6-phosphate 1-dehydrogenase
MESKLPVTQRRMIQTHLHQVLELAAIDIPRSVHIKQVKRISQSLDFLLCLGQLQVGFR